MNSTFQLFVIGVLFMFLVIFGLSLAARSIASAIRGKSAFWYAATASLLLAIPAVTILPKWWLA